MQQLLGDKVEAMDSSLLSKLFLQQLPSNVRMILASTAKGSNLQELVPQFLAVFLAVGIVGAGVATAGLTGGVVLNNLRI